MSITTMEQLETLPEGARITVTSRGTDQTWEKADGLFLRDGAAVRSINFVGAVEAGSVRAADATVIATNRVGQYYDAGGMGWVVHTVGEDGTLHTVWTAPGNTRLEDHPPGFFGAGWTSPTPGWVEHVARLGRQQWEAQQTEPTPAPSSDFISSLHKWIEEHEWYGEADKLALDEFLSEHGYSRSTDHEIEVRLWGTVPMNIETSEAREILGLDTEFDIEAVSRATVEWERTATLSRRGEGCTCDQIQREDLASLIPRNAELSDFEVSCA